MKKNLILLPAILLCVGGSAVAQNLKPITQEKATRIVKTLSADDMMGRSVAGSSSWRIVAID